MLIGMGLKKMSSEQKEEKAHTVTKEKIKSKLNKLNAESSNPPTFRRVLAVTPPFYLYAHEHCLKRILQKSQSLAAERVR